jgi:hypothetical protein
MAACIAIMWQAALVFGLTLQLSGFAKNTTKARQAFTAWARKHSFGSTGRQGIRNMDCSSG